MALVRWEPIREIHAIQREMNRLFGAAFDSQTGNVDIATRRWVPATDLLEQDDRYLLRTDLPGVTEQDVKVELDENVLTISGERRSEEEQSKDGYRRIERISGSFSRSLRLPDGVDPEKLRASFENGVLEVSIPKPERRKPRRVTIGVGARDSEASATDSE